MTYAVAPDACLIFLVRHAATLHNLARPPRIQGCGEDPPLSDAGRAQASCAARLLARQPITAVYASPLQRALETASIIAQPHALAATTVAALHEVDVGDWEGRSWEEIERDDPAAYARFLDDPAQCGYAGGENLQQVQQRTLPALRVLAQQDLGQLVLIVGHNVVNRVLLATWLGIPLARARGIDQDNGGVNVIRYSQDQFKVLTVNSAFHLYDAAEPQ
ncbi:MAG: histidine phosphatase family protein [Pirellulaceae bacterium]|jgi:broad specificity phosphatase PhoE|nr:histidine phosphatase family protein [Pirellulaceae bacterium]